MKVYYDRDANVGALRERRVAVIGYGSQGFAQSNNLKESGVDVTVGLKADSPSRAKAEAAGLEVVEDRCVKIEHGRFFGGLGWAGVNTKVISAKRAS